MDPTLYSTQAEDLAKELAEDCEKSRRRKNKRTQIRKFYDEVIRPLPVSDRAKRYELMMQHEGVKVLYHTAEQLGMDVDLGRLVGKSLPHDLDHDPRDGLDVRSFER